MNLCESNNTWSILFYFLGILFGVICLIEIVVIVSLAFYILGLQKQVERYKKVVDAYIAGNLTEWTTNKQIDTSSTQTKNTSALSDKPQGKDTQKKQKRKRKDSPNDTTQVSSSDVSIIDSPKKKKSKTPSSKTEEQQVKTNANSISAQPANAPQSTATNTGVPDGGLSTDRTGKKSTSPEKEKDHSEKGQAKPVLTKANKSTMLDGNEIGSTTRRSESVAKSQGTNDPTKQ